MAKLPGFVLAGIAFPARAQTFPIDDPVIRRIWQEGMTEHSQVEPLAQVHYGPVFRLAAHNQGPRLRLDGDDRGVWRVELR